MIEITLEGNTMTIPHEWRSSSEIIFFLLSRGELTEFTGHKL